MDVHGRDLRYFVAVAEELHFTLAAQRLFISQPALSKQVRLLEKALGADLFARDRRGVRLTPAGEALLPHARRVLEAWAEARAALEQARATEETRLVIGMSTSPGRGGMLPAVRSRLTEAHPAAVLELRQVGWQDPTAGLADGSSDVAFVWLPVADRRRYRWIVMAAEPRHVALPSRHPLAAKDAVVMADLVDEPFLALPESAGALRDFWLAADERGGRAARIGAVVNNPDETYEALVDGRGVCLVAQGNATLLTRGDVVTRPVTDIGACNLALAWRADDARPLVRAYARAAAGYARAVAAPA
ncbi:LysR family transcriptional regulator [Actinocrinis puniceicyclus]|uniref:LysR family transcriptional regulator n=1 Tax=Actinocrinis puniceicyclus TaxID=977794 RepID=A0A8J7WS95_9ACTN|nr:LysR family transcriptional regulator [Actinocrinis puniceicyclus]MBS2965795.1 LysR family transcriptional regulator [Actinocrinis puniceicyclus]